MGSVHVAAFWELGWNTPIKEIDLWDVVIRDFGVEKFYMTPISGIADGSVIERPSLDVILEENSDRPVVFCSEEGEELLSDFEHPENVLYVFGKTNFSPFLTHKREGDLSLKLTTKINAGLLFGHHAAAIILYDRVQKWQ